MTKKSMSTLFTALFLLLAEAALILLLSYPVIRPGEVYSPDLKNGFDIYIEEGYPSAVPSFWNNGSASHSMWRVTDRELKNRIADLCMDIQCYRGLDPVHDVMLGGPSDDLDYSVPPTVCIVTDKAAYRIAPMNWANFAGPAWDNFPIRQEAAGQPVMQFGRIDLGARPDDMDLYSFIAHSSGYDTDTVAKLYSAILKPGDRFTASRYSCWYSMMPSQDGMDSLLALAGSVGPENSEKVCEYPRKG